MAGIKAVGDFQVVEAKIITSSGMLVNILENSGIIAISIFENIGMMAVTGEILLQDSFALTSVGPIIGQEYLKLKIQTPSLTDVDHIIDFTENVFIINSLEKRTDVGNNVQVYKLNFTF